MQSGIGSMTGVIAALVAIGEACGPEVLRAMNAKQLHEDQISHVVRTELVGVLKAFAQEHSIVAKGRFSRTEQTRGRKPVRRVNPQSGGQSSRSRRPG
ncbi:MAG TPA: hypothetical protein PKC43_06170 [Phycisphaerales bacterium]|nr:hypothetical protein [Phycisphaerales bacterium]HMP37017.1 hypothetical protein [Phycisphaerales bacterium]